MLHWPSAETLTALSTVDLLPLWLERQLDRLMNQHGDVRTWRHQCFGPAVASLFLQRRAELERLQISVLQLEDPHLAQECWFRLHAGEADFQELRNISGDPSQRTLLEGVQLADLDPHLHPLLKRLEPGELAPPMANPDGSLLLLRLDQRWPATLDAHTREQLEQELHAQWRQSVLQPLLQSPPAPGTVVTIPQPTAS